MLLDDRQYFQSRVTYVAQHFHHTAFCASTFRIMFFRGPIRNFHNHFLIVGRAAKIPA